MEIKIGMTDVAREVIIESTSTSDEVAAQLRTAIETSSLFELADDKGRRVFIPVSKIAYVDLGPANARAVGFGTV